MRSPASEHVEPVEIDTPDGQMPGLLWLPPGGRGPGLMLAQEVFGVSAYVERRAADLAALGYVVLVPSFYWRLPDAGPFEGPDALERALPLAGQFDWSAGVADGVDAVRWLRARAEVTGGVALVGFCFGGGLAFNIAAREPVQALVSYYGSALPGLLELAPRVAVPSIHHFGLADSFIDNPTVATIRDAVSVHPEVEFWTYEDAEHAFDNSDWAGHHPAASTQAWERTVDFLRRTMPTG